MVAPNIFGSVKKFRAGSVSLNFGLSGGAYCDLACIHHPDNDGDCYAARLEKHRQAVRESLAKRERMSAAAICGAALVELQRRVNRGEKPPWLRISSAGAVPSKQQANKLYIAQLRALLSYCKLHGVPVHFPVETHAKARYYRARVGDLVVVRESLQAPRAHKRTRGAVSFTGGQRVSVKRNIRETRIMAARRESKQRYLATGRKTIVCPAAVDSMRRAGNPLAKCGSCLACALPHIDVCYPKH